MKTQRATNIPVFIQCPNCGILWSDRDTFLSDPQVELIGYQVNFMHLLAGFFLFNHSCQGTFSVQTEAFADLYDGPVYSQPATGSEQCPEYCLRKNELKPCPVKCECAFVREIMQIIQAWPKFHPPEELARSNG